MSTDSDEYRVISWWPSEDERVIVSVKRTPETEAQSDEELIAQWEERMKNRDHPGDLADG